MNNLRPREATLYLLGHTGSQSWSKDDTRSLLTLRAGLLLLSQPRLLPFPLSHLAYSFTTPLHHPLLPPAAHLPMHAHTDTHRHTQTHTDTHRHTHTHTLGHGYIFQIKLLTAAFLLSYYAVSLYLSEL